ncbi:2-hydroxychromene-2-carboxylate isomerase, partial [bacterium AH-315-P15]|nr:2-hydroxychromene-2-carboxylate isomerase [bacterium AH-315-P15]
RIAEAAGATLDYRPMLLGGVMKATGNAPPGMVPAKGAWMAQDLPRWAAKYGVPMTFNPHFPVNTLPLMRGAVALLGDDSFAPYVEAMFNAMWREPRNMGKPAEIAGVVSSLGMDADDFAARIQNPDIKQKLKALTEEAVARGAFGAPTIFVGEDMFFGQDRLFMVAEAVGIHISDVVPGY